LQIAQLRPDVAIDVEAEERRERQYHRPHLLAAPAAEALEAAELGGGVVREHFWVRVHEAKRGVAAEADLVEPAEACAHIVPQQLWAALQQLGEQRVVGGARRRIDCDALGSQPHYPPRQIVAERRREGADHLACVGGGEPAVPFERREGIAHVGVEEGGPLARHAQRFLVREAELAELPEPLW
jgi:hypothetical protein